jgi:ribosomal protein S18 acetylase RimI-like enzyme
MTPSSPQLASRLPLYTSVEIANELSMPDLYDLCDATDAAIEAGGGFGWVTPPAREVLEKYWRGVLVVPERHLFIARMDGMVCGAVQLVEPTRHNEAQSFTATILANFVAPWARGHGAGRKLMETAEKLAFEMGYNALQLDVRETQDVAISLYESMKFRRWGTNPMYAMVGDRFVAGHHYGKLIRPLFVPKKISND